jgi:hypothetical protein
MLLLVEVSAARVLTLFKPVNLFMTTVTVTTEDLVAVPVPITMLDRKIGPLDGMENAVVEMLRVMLSVALWVRTTTTMVQAAPTMATMAMTVATPTTTPTLATARATTTLLKPLPLLVLQLSQLIPRLLLQMPHNTDS